MHVKGKKVLITGASSGLGEELLYAFAAKGAVCAAASRNIARLDQIRINSLSRYPDTPAPALLKCDITDYAQVASMIERCKKSLGGIDILVNNAGIGVYGTFANMTEKDFESVMAVNLYGAVSCIRNVVPHMQNGLIVNVASAAGLFGVPYLSAYSASKAALIAFSQALRAELSGTGTKISIVYPGYIQTDFFKNEKNVGGAVRPKGPYYSAAKAARIIVNSIERNKKDIYISKESIGLEIASRISRSVVEKVMNSIKIKLEVKAEGNHG